WSSCRSVASRLSPVIGGPPSAGRWGSHTRQHSSSCNLCPRPTLRLRTADGGHPHVGCDDESLQNRYYRDSRGSSCPARIFGPFETGHVQRERRVTPPILCSRRRALGHGS